MISKKVLTAIAVLLLSACGGTTAAAQTLVASDSNPSECRLPEPFENQALIDQLLEVSPGDTVEQVSEQITESSDEGYIKYNRPGDFGVINWTRAEGDGTLQLAVDFENQQVTNGSVTLAYNLGTNEETLCYWQVQ